MTWSKKAGIAFGPDEQAAFVEVCSKHDVPSCLIEELLELEISEQRSKRGPIADLLQSWAKQKDKDEWTSPQASSAKPKENGLFRFLSLQMKNFALFRDTGITFDWDVTRPLCLVEGNNGYGKTKLLEALRFVLYGLPPRSRPESYLHRSAEKPRARMEVSLQLSTPENEKVLIRRFIDFAKILGDWNMERQVAVVKHDDRSLQDSDAQDWIDSRLPQHVMECFVFDAENSSVAGLAVGGAETSVADQLEKVMGITLLRTIHRRVSDLEKDWNRKLDEILPVQSVRQARAGLEKVEAELEKVEQDISNKSQQVQKKTDEKEILEQKLDELLTHFDPAEEEVRERRLARLGVIEEDEKRIGQELIDSVGRSLPIQLLFEHIQYALERSRAARRDEASGSFHRGVEHAARKLSQFFSDETLPWGEKPVPEADTIFTKIAAVLPLQEGSSPDHNVQLSATAISDLQAMLDEAVRITTPRELVRKLRDYHSERAGFGDLNSTSSAGPATGDLSKRHSLLQADYTEIVSQLTRYEERLRDLRQRAHSLREQQVGKKGEVGDAQKGEKKHEVLSHDAKFAGTVVACLSDLADRLRDLKVEELEAGATEMFTKTTNKPDLYAGVVFNRETLRYRVIDHDGSTAPLDRSTGEQTVLSLAVVHGLQRASGRLLPLVIEAPFKPLDPVHTDKVIRHAFEAGSGQTVLLVKPDEVPVAHRDILQVRLGQRFVLERPDPAQEESIIVRLEG